MEHLVNVDFKAEAAHKLFHVPIFNFKLRRFFKLFQKKKT